MKRMNEYEVILNGFYNSEDKNKAQNKAIKILEDEGIVNCSIATTLTK